MKKLLSIIIIAFMLLGISTSPSSANTRDNSKISDEVWEALDSLEKNDELSVYVIVSDIDQDALSWVF